MPKIINDDNEELKEGSENGKSKSQVKKELLALQDLGIELSKLSAEQQAQIPLDETLREAIEQAPKIKGNSSKKRHFQYIGKLIRKANIEAIEAAYHKVCEENHRAVRLHHIYENWRDQLIEGDKVQLESFINEYPNLDRQKLRQLVAGAQQERSRPEAPPKNARALFKFIRETLESHSKIS